MPRPLLPLACVLLVVGGGCQGARIRPGEPLGAATPPAATPVAPAPVARLVPGGRAPSGGRVDLSPSDLAPVDAYLAARNRQWILGDEVDVVASKEYFAQALSLNENVNWIRRYDRQVGDDTLVTMTFLGTPAQASALTNPRVQIGTGLAVSARRTLRVRLTKTTDPRVPVRLRVVANGKAVRGRRDQVTHRADVLEIGGVMRWTGSGWLWAPVER